MLVRLLRTRDDPGLTVARLGLALVVLPHGLQKLFGWFGGFGFEGTMGFLTDSLGIPTPIALLVIAGESLGAASLLVGFLGRFCAASIAVILAGAAVRVHIDNGFFMNWTGTGPGEGYEFHILAVALAIVVAIGGSGAISVDLWLARRGEDR